MCPEGGSGSQDLQVSPPTRNNRCVFGVLVIIFHQIFWRYYFGDISPAFGDISPAFGVSLAQLCTIGFDITPGFGDDISPPSRKNRCGLGVSNCMVYFDGDVSPPTSCLWCNCMIHDTI